VFVSGKPFWLSRIFAGKARAYPTVEYMVMHFSRILALPQKILLAWKGLPGTNTLAYQENLYILELKSFITLAKVKPYFLLSKIV
jgi:hypothetical protein